VDGFQQCSHELPSPGKKGRAAKQKTPNTGETESSFANR
jgi:hypothetical protein